MITQDIANAITLHLQENLKTSGIDLTYQTRPLHKGETSTTIHDTNAPPAYLKSIVTIDYGTDQITATSQLGTIGGSWLRQRKYDYTDPNIMTRIEDYIETLLKEWARHKESELHHARRRNNGGGEGNW